MRAARSPTTLAIGARAALALFSIIIISQGGADIMPRMTGGKLLADTVRGYGITHVFFMPYIAPRALM